MGRRVLVVEGEDDEHVVKHICGAHRLGQLQFERANGIDLLLADLEAILMTAREGDVVGILVDADLDPAARWQALSDRLGRIGYGTVPRTPFPSGTILEPPSARPDAILPRLGLWLMPDNRVPGAIEDFLALLVPPGSPLWVHVEASVDGIPPTERRFKASYRAKALIHTWLAWQATPGRRLGSAITERYLDPTSPQADLFADWLQRLYRW